MWLDLRLSSLSILQVNICNRWKSVWRSTLKLQWRKLLRLSYCHSSDDTDAPSGIASGRLAVGSAVMWPHLFAAERLSCSARGRVRVVLISEYHIICNNYMDRFFLFIFINFSEKYFILRYSARPFESTNFSSGDDPRVSRTSSSIRANYSRCAIGSRGFHLGAEPAAPGRPGTFDYSHIKIERQKR